MNRETRRKQLKNHKAVAPKQVKPVALTEAEQNRFSGIIDKLILASDEYLKFVFEMELADTNKDLTVIQEIAVEISARMMCLHALDNRDLLERMGKRILSLREIYYKLYADAQDQKETNNEKIDTTKTTN